MSKISDTIVNQYDEIQKLKIDSVLRKNGDFAFADNLKELIINNYFKEQDNLWEFFDTASDKFAQILYESVANMMENITDIDLCTLEDLNNIALMLNVSNTSLFSLPFPDEFITLIDTYSVNKEYVLYGRHSTTDIETVFGIDDFDRNNPDHAEQVNSGYMSELVDTSFKEVFLNLLYDPTSEDGIETIGFLELIVPDEFLTTEYDYLVGVRDGTVDRLSDSDHYALLNDGDMLDVASKFMRNFCIRVLFFRENLKSIAQKNSILGTQKIIEKMLTEYVIQGYSNIEDFGFHVPLKTQEEVLAQGVNNDSFRSWTRFLNTVVDLGSLLDVEVVEYYDTTEYMNITPSAIPYKTNLVPITELYSEPYLNASGQIEYLDPVLRTIGYEEVESSEFAKGQGNTRYWEGAIDEEGNETILEMFTRLGMIEEGDDIEVLMTFLSEIYSKNSPNEWSDFSPTDYASVADLANMDAKYINNVTGYIENAPWVNAKSTDYPTIAPIAWMWNLVEKTFLTFPRLIKYSTEDINDFSTNYVNYVDIEGDQGDLYSPGASGTMGIIIDSWRSEANEYFSYAGYHETETNLDDISEVNKNAQVDGSFNMLALGDLLDTYSNPIATGSYTAASGLLNAIMSKYYENL
jgi:hypothetical protein